MSCFSTCHVSTGFQFSVLGMALTCLMDQGSKRFKFHKLFKEHVDYQHLNTALQLPFLLLGIWAICSKGHGVESAGKNGYIQPGKNKFFLYMLASMLVFFLSLRHQTLKKNSVSVFSRLLGYLSPESTGENRSLEKVRCGLQLCSSEYLYSSCPTLWAETLPYHRQEIRFL